NTFQQQQQTAVTSQLHQNTYQTVTTVRTSSLIDMQQTTLTNDTTQQLTGMSQIPTTSSLINDGNIISYQPTSILNGNTLSTHERDMSPVNNDN
ncbi:unnamed protein product, partial [Adineta steineri]